MEILNLGNNNEDAPASKSPRAKKLKVAKAAVGIGTIASLTGLGSTLAANISLNGGSNVEFGQGVAQTAACDEDGFTITPVSYYDSDSSTFRLDYVEVSGLNLTPMGENYGSDSSVSYASEASAIAAHPGQYFDLTTSEWTNTCDQVVLDFKAYTDDVDYVANTVDGFDALYHSEALPNTVASPLMWNVYGNGGVVDSNSQSAFNSDIAIIFDAGNDEVNYGTNSLNSDSGPGSRTYLNYSVNIATTFPNDYGADSSFQFFAGNGHHAHEIWSDINLNVDPAAGAISKITVESMKYFTSDYYSDNSGTNDNLGWQYGNPLL